MSKTITMNNKTNNTNKSSIIKVVVAKIIKDKDLLHSLNNSSMKNLTLNSISNTMKRLTRTMEGS